MNNVNKEMSGLTQEYIQKMLDIVGEVDQDNTANLLTSLTIINASFLPMAAHLGEIKNHKEYSEAQKAVFMGNQCVAHAIEVGMDKDFYDND